MGADRAGCMPDVRRPAAVIRKLLARFPTVCRMPSRVIVDSRWTGQLAALLRQLRELAGMTQEELAERSGLSIRTISNLERGRTAVPQRRSIEMLADALGLAGDSLDRFHEAARVRSVAQCPVCSTEWRLDGRIPPGQPGPVARRPTASSMS
jgi:transcriptional regulator with XRE-family HTH domain